MKMNWALYSLIAAISFAGLVLTYKKLLLLGINQVVLNLSIFFLVFLGFSSFVFFKKVPLQLTGAMVLLLMLAATFSFLGNYFQVKSYSEAPNPGYASTLVATQLILITLFSVLLFQSELSWVKVLGIAVVIAGSYLVGM